MKCPNCGAELEARTIFCPNCDKKIDYDILDKEEADSKKSRREQYEDALEDSPFAGIYARNARRWSIVIAIFDIITWGMFFSSWYQSKIGKVFGMGDYGLFDIYETLVSMNKYGMLKGAGIPFYFWLLLFSIIIFYFISSAYFFRSIVRNFANKVHVRTQITASVFALITAMTSYIAVVIFQNGFDNAIGGRISSYLISTSTFFIIFIVMNILLIILSYSYLRNAKNDFSNRAYNAFSIITIIYLICLIIGLLISCGIINRPNISFSGKSDDYGYDYLWESSNSYIRYEDDDYEDDYEDDDYDYDSNYYSSGLYEGHNIPYNDVDSYGNEESEISYSLYFPDSGCTKYYDEYGNVIKETYDFTLEELWDEEKSDDVFGIAFNTLCTIRWVIQDSFDLYHDYTENTFDEIEEINSLGKSYIEYEYDTDGNLLRKNNYNPDGTFAGGYAYEYDGFGNVIDEFDYNSDGSIHFHYTYTYDSAGNLLIRTIYKSDGSIEMSYIKEYDSMGNIIRNSSVYSDGNVASYSEYEYDSNGNLLRQNCFDSDGNINFYYKYEYDLNGNMIEESMGTVERINSYTDYVYDSEGGLTKKSLFYMDSNDFAILEHEEEYDSSGNLTKYITYDPDGSVYDYSVNEYDSDNLLVKKIYYDSYGDVSSFEKYEYDSNGNLTNCAICFSDESVYVNTNYTYDEKGNLLKEASYNSEGILYYSHECKYDSSGRLTKESSFYNISQQMEDIY